MTTPTVPTRQSFHVAGGRGLNVPTVAVAHDPTPRRSSAPWDRWAALPPLDDAGQPITAEAVAQVIGADRTVVVPRPRHGLDEVQTAKMVTDYLGGLGLIPCARKYGIRQETARRILVANDVTIRPRGGRTKAPRA